MIYDIIDSPLGKLTIGTDGQHITSLHIEGDQYFSGPPIGWLRDPSQPVLRQVRHELAEYFAGIRRDFSVPVLARGTQFQEEVWQAIQQIPSGQTVTYATLAERVGKPKAARPVGTAVGRNPVCILIPCHRVLASDGTFGGFVAGVPKKQRLLVLEGAI